MAATANVAFSAARAAVSADALAIMPLARPSAIEVAVDAVGAMMATETSTEADVMFRATSSIGTPHELAKVALMASRAAASKSETSPALVNDAATWNW